MGGLSWWHWIIILGAFVLLFGAKKLPDAARGVGRSLRILKSEVSAMSDDDSSKNDNGETRQSEAIVSPTPVVSPVRVSQVSVEPLSADAATNSAAGLHSTTAA